MDAFFASVEQKLNPSLNNKPVFVSGNTAKDSIVAACSYQAKKYGVKSGMSLYEALDLCPDAVIVRSDPEKYISTSRAIFDVIKSLTEKVEVYSIDEAFADFTNTIHLFSDKKQLGMEIKKTVKKNTGLACSVGIGPNKIIAKIASDICKPDGLFVVEPETVGEFMKDLPVEKIPGIGPKTREKLNLMGIVYCGQVKNIPCSFLEEKFGVLGRSISDWCSGKGATEIKILSPEPKSFGHSYTLPENTAKKEILKSVLFRLSHQTAVRMREEGYCGKTIAVTVRMKDFATYSKHITLPFWCDDEQTIYNFAWTLVSAVCTLKNPILPELQKNIFTDKGNTAEGYFGIKIRLLGVSVSGLRKKFQMNLFNNEQRRKLTIAADGVNRKYGEGTVFYGLTVFEEKWHKIVTKTHAFQPKPVVFS